MKSDAHADYETVLAAAHAASSKYAKACENYRAGRIDDATYLAERAAFAASEVAFSTARGES